MAIYYDLLRLPDGSATRLEVRSMETFMSPFEEDELDVRTCIRLGGAVGAEEEEDTEQTTRLRRQMA